MNTNRLAVVLTVINFILLIMVLAQSRAIANQTVPVVLRVQALQLVDENGEVRAQLNVDETNGEKVGASEDGLGLLLVNHLTEPDVHILANLDGSSLILTEEGGATATRVIVP